MVEGRLATNPVDGARRPRKPTESAANGLSRHELTDWLEAAEGRGGDACRAGVHHKGYKPAVVALAPRTVQAVGLAVAHRRSGALLCNRHGDRSPNQLNRHATYAIAQYLAGGN